MTTVEQIERNMHAVQVRIQDRAEKQEVRLKKSRVYARTITTLYVLCGITLLVMASWALLEDSPVVAAGGLALSATILLTARLIAPRRKQDAA